MRTALTVSLALVSLSGCATGTSDTSTAALESRVSALEQTAADLQQTVTTLQTDNADLQDKVTALQADNTDLHSQLASYVTSDALTTTLGGYVPLIHTETLTVTSSPSGSNEFASVAAALASLNDARIAAEGMVTIQVDAGTYNIDPPNNIVFDHPDGDRIFVVGPDPTSGTTAEFDYTQLDKAVTVAPGHVARGPYNVTLVGSDQGTGIYVSDGAMLDTTAVFSNYKPPIVQHFGNGIVAEDGGIVIANGSSTSDNAYIGYFANGGSLLVAKGATSDGDAQAFDAVNGAVLLADGANADNVQTDGRAFAAYADSYLEAYSAHVKNISQSAIVANHDSVVNAESATFDNAADPELFERYNSHAFTYGACTYVSTTCSGAVTSDPSDTTDYSTIETNP